MTSEMWLNNLIAYALQILILIAAGAIAIAAFRIRRPGARLIVLRLMLLSILALPFIQPWQAPSVDSRRASTAPAAVNHAPTSNVQVATGLPTRVRSFGFNANTYLTLLGVCMLLRVAWLALGIFSLRR